MADHPSDGRLTSSRSLVPGAAASGRSVYEIGRPGLRISGATGDSITLYLGRTLKRATLIETDGTIVDMKRRFEVNQIDAFGANRQRLTALRKELPAGRLLPDNILDVARPSLFRKGEPRRFRRVIHSSMMFDSLSSTGAGSTFGRIPRPSRRTGALG